MLILRYLILYIIILSGAIFIADKFNKKLENTVLLSLSGIIIGLYICGIFNLLFQGVIIISAINVFGLVYTLIKNIKQKSTNNLVQKITTPGTVFFTIAFFIFMITSMNRELVHWDQFSYWSIVVKDMFYTDSISLTTQAITQYPPVNTVLQYFFMKIVGEYRQGIEIFTTWMLVFAFLLPLFEKTNGRKITNFVIAIMILCLPATFYALEFYQTSWPDAILGVIIGCCSYQYFFEKDSKFKNVSVLVQLIVLTLCKATGVIISIILIITFFVFQILQKRNEKMTIKAIFLSKELKVLLVFCISIIITYMSWIIYLKNVELNIPSLNSIEQNINNDKIQKVIQSLETTVGGVYYENNDAAISNGRLIEHLNSAQQIIVPTKISLMGIIVTYICLALIYYYRCPNDEKNLIKHISISVLLGVVLYIIALQLAYIVQFSSDEMLGHAGLIRYMASYLFAILYIIVMILLENFQKKDNTVFYAILTSIIVLITPVDTVANATITSGIYNINSTISCNTGRFRANNIKKEIQNDDKILGIGQEKKGILLNLMIRYYMYPLKYETCDAINENNRLQNMLNKGNYDYIYVTSTDPYLNKELKETLGIDNVEIDKLYKVK